MLALSDLPVGVHVLIPAASHLDNCQAYLPPYF
jgi:hypothetical protein